jgi:DNA-binding MarR family transcriptional regulator
MSPGEERTLRALDVACWENSEAGGDGWVAIRDLAGALGVRYSWASQLLGFLERRGWAERRRRRLVEYAPSEAGAALLLALDTNSEDHR